MQLAQSFLGDPPCVGFAIRQSSTGFPVERPYMNDITIPRINNMTINVSEMDDGLYTISSVYELHSVSYGVLCAFFSSRGHQVLQKRATGREHSYLQMVAFPHENNQNAADCWSLSQLLSFDAFLSMEKFWQLPKNFTLFQLPWEAPEEINVPSVTLTLQTLALVGRYWQAASQRAFENKNNVSTVWVTLSQNDDCQTVINDGKRLLSTVIAPHLPKAVQNIVSMSCGVRSVLTPFDPTALAVVMPSVAPPPTVSNHFDLRTSNFPTLETLEEAFFTDVLINHVPCLQDLKACYAKSHPTDETPSFEADHFVWYSVWFLQNKHYQNDLQKALEIIRQLHLRLENKHHLSTTETTDMLSLLEQTVLGNLVTLDTSCSDAQFFFLIQQSTFSSEALYPLQEKLLINYQKQHLAHFFVEVLPRNCKDENRLATLMQNLLHHVYLENTLTLNQLSTLSNMEPQGFGRRCQSSPLLRKVMIRYILDYTASDELRIPFMTPLSKHFLNEQDLLEQNLQLLCKNFVQTAPSEELCHKICMVMNENISAECLCVLCDYFVDLLNTHLGQWNTVKDVIDALRVPECAKTDILCAYFAQCETLLSKVQCQEVFSLFVQNEETLNAFLTYVKRRLTLAVEENLPLFDWFFGVASTLGIPPKTIAVIGIDHLCTHAMKTQIMPTSKQFERVFAMPRNVALQELCNELLCAFWPQSQGIALRYLDEIGNVDPYPQLQQWLQELTRNVLIQGFEKGKYWETINATTSQYSQNGTLDWNTICNEELQTKAISCAKAIYASAKSLQTLKDYRAAQQEHACAFFTSTWKKNYQETFQTQFVLLIQNSQTLETLQTLQKERSNISSSSQCDVAFQTQFIYLIEKSQSLDALLALRNVRSSVETSAECEPAFQTQFQTLVARCKTTQDLQSLIDQGRSHGALELLKPAITLQFKNFINQCQTIGDISILQNLSQSMSFGDCYNAMLQTRFQTLLKENRPMQDWCQLAKSYTYQPIKSWICCVFQTQYPLLVRQCESIDQFHELQSLCKSLGACVKDPVSQAIEKIESFVKSNFSEDDFFPKLQTLLSAMPLNQYANAYPQLRTLANQLIEQQMQLPTSSPFVQSLLWFLPAHLNEDGFRATQVLLRLFPAMQIQKAIQNPYATDLLSLLQHITYFLAFVENKATDNISSALLNELCSYHPYVDYTQALRKGKKRNHYFPREANLSNLLTNWLYAPSLSK